jgi:tetratricopeptide (TPR) repeat protein
MNKKLFFLLLILTTSINGQELLKNFNFLNYKQSNINLDQINEIWLKSQDLNNDDLQGLAKRANDKIGYGYFTEALADLNKAILVDSTIAYLFNLRAICFLNLDSSYKAEKSFITASNLDSSDAVSKYYIAGFLINRSSFDSAETILKNYDKKFPDSYLINYGLANLYLSQIKPEKAIRFYKRSAELNPEFPEAWFSIGLINLYTYDTYNASRFFEKTIKYNPEYAPAWFMKGFILLNQGNLNKTLEYWNQAVAYDSINEYYKISRGILKVYMMDYKNGFAEINSILSDSAGTNFFRDFTEIDQQKSQFEFKEQLYYYNLYNESLSKGLRVALQEYLCKFLISDYSGAEEVLRKTSLMFENNSLVDFYTAINSEYFRDWKKSEEFYKKSLNESPLINANNLHLAILLQNQVKYSESIEYLDKFLQFDSSSALVYRYRGIANMQTGNIESALNDFDNYFSVDSFDLDLTYNKGICYKALKKYDEAIVQFDTILNHMANDNETRFQKAECLLFKGEIDSSLSNINKIEPFYYITYAKSYLLRGKLNMLQKNYSAALFDFNNYLDREPSDIDCLFLVSKIYKTQKNYEKLIETYSRILDLNSELPEIYYLRAMAYLVIKNNEAVCKDLKSSFEKGYSQAEFAINSYCKKQE